MDSGNSGSISSSGDEEYDSRAGTVSPFLTQFGSISQSHPHSSLLSHHQNQHPLFDLSYLHALSQSHPNSNPNSLLNLDTASSLGRRSEQAGCTDPANLPGASSAAANKSLLNPHSQAFDQCSTEPSLQLRSAQDDNTRGVSLSGPGNAVRNSKKRTRASRRAPTTVLTTDTSNFRAMVQEFTGIPAPPFSGTSYSRRLDLLTGSSSLRSSSSHLETPGAFYPLRPSPQKIQPNPLLLSFTSSISSSSPSTLLHTNMVDAIASTTTTNNSSASINYQLPPDLGLPYNQPQNMLSMQNHPILPFQSPPPLHPMNNNPLAGFGAKSQGTLSIPLLEDLGMSHGGQVNAHLLSGVPPAPSTAHAHVTSQGMPLRNDGGGSHGERGASEGRRDHLLRSFEGSFGKQVITGSCKLNFSASSNSSSSFNHEKTLDNTIGRGEGTVDSWICSSD
ncbi:hypothetical protein L6164_016091 [Bauhinia variegata]|uniref:Uncharacterized protein n=1 Tax=Bauhinia variegata TaxID=167791 RepID=A0ACB9NMK0_BAUVA|nr:hypothetical protein L6164_016091 [Bauhinia variegata]